MANGKRKRTWELVDEGRIDLDRVLVVHGKEVTVRDLIRRIEDDREDCGKGFIPEDHVRRKLDKMAAPIVALPDGRIGRRDRPIGRGGDSLDDAFERGYMKAIRDLREWLAATR